MYKDDQKICKICKTWFPRPPGKSDTVWSKQKCCGTDCSAISRRKELPIRNRRIKLIPGNRRYTGWGN
jgi:hypothetical protein